MTRQDHVSILMAVRNGARYLPQQLASLAQQGWQDWSLLVGDDGSDDDSRGVLSAFAQTRPEGQVQVVEGPRLGAAANFRHLLDLCPKDSGFVAFCDQDDVWLPEKLARAVAALRQSAHDLPLIWASRVTNVDAQLQPLLPSALPRKPLSFRHALIQNSLQGNSMVMNNAALALAQGAGGRDLPMPMHDWGLYQLVTGVGGRVIYEPQPMLLYRQHGDNVVGAADTLRSKAGFLARLKDGKQAEWAQMNLALLNANADHLTPENRQILRDFAQLRGPLLRRISALRRGGFYRQSAAGQVMLWAETLLGAR